MLLPDQTYEQCQEILAPLKKCLVDTHFETKVIVHNENIEYKNDKKLSALPKSPSSILSQSQSTPAKISSLRQQEKLQIQTPASVSVSSPVKISQPTSFLLANENVNGKKKITNEKIHKNRQKKIITTNQNDRQSRKSFSRTLEFFNNIPEYMGSPLGPFSLSTPLMGGGCGGGFDDIGEDGADSGGGGGNGGISGGIGGDNCGGRRLKTDADILKECEQFLYKHRIRPDFFCRYRKATQAATQSSPPSWPKATKSHSSRIGKDNNNQETKKYYFNHNANDDDDDDVDDVDEINKEKLEDTIENKKQNRQNNSSSINTTIKMRRFQKSLAIYTIPHRGKRRRSIISSTTPTTTTATTTTATTTATTPASASDASSSNEAVHLQQRLKSLSTELVTLRNRLHVGQTATAGGGGTGTVNGNGGSGGGGGGGGGGGNGGGSTITTNGTNLNNNNNNNNNNNSNYIGMAPQIPTSGINNNIIAPPSQPPPPTPITSSNSMSSTPAIPIGNSNKLSYKQTYPSSNGCQPPATNSIPVVSPRNTSIPHPLPHHASTTSVGGGGGGGGKEITQFGSGNGTLPRNSSGFGNNGGGGGGHLTNDYIDTMIPIKPRVMSPCKINNSHQQKQQQQQHHHQQMPLHQHTDNHNLNNNHNNSYQQSTQHNQHHQHQYHQQQNNSQQNQHQSYNNINNNNNNNNNNEYNEQNMKQQHQLQMTTQTSTTTTATTTTTVKRLPKDMEDLIHLPGPLTEDAVMRSIQARFADGKYFTNVGPILLSINPYQDVGNPLTLSSTRSLQLAPQLHRIVQEAVRQQAETGYPQAIILSGTSGAGKTHCSMLLLRQLFAVAGGGPETDAFKHLAAAFTVLRSLGSAKTSTNSESSRIGQFIEVQVTDGALYRTKIHCYFLDQTRVIRPLPNEKNYHIFYQMLAGLNRDERVKLNLEGYSPANLRYLQAGDIHQDEQEDATRFQAWKACLGILGIPFLDVVRVLAAVLLLGNVQFVDGQGLEVDVKGESELNAVASLLGVPASALFRGLTTRTHNARGQLVKSVCDANMSNMTRDSLAKALYCRTVATIVRRANSLKRLGSTLGTLSSDSNESVHNQADVQSQHASTIGGGGGGTGGQNGGGGGTGNGSGNAGSKSMAALNNAVRHATDGFIGILDMFGFEEPRPAQLEHLCINLCAETMQHFYNTHIFKSSVESCRDEGIMCDTEIDYVDNVPCIDLISSLRTGLLSMLDAECSVRGTAESYVAKIKVQHRNSTRLDGKPIDLHDPRIFTIRHFAGRVEYDTTDFLDTNRDVVPDDLVSVFYKHTCNFGFVTHLFGSELKALYAYENVPRGLSFRIAPTSHTDLLNGDEPVSTLTQDFHTRLDNLLRTLVHARPHFVRCIRSNGAEITGKFERQTVVQQIRALQVLETVNLMASGFPHRMRFKQFTARYRMLAPFRLLRRNEEKALDDCKLILQYALENPPDIDGSVTLSWAPGKRHVFLSEGIRQHLEKLRSDVRTKSATAIQSVWRGWQLRRRISCNTVRKTTRDLQVLMATTTNNNNSNGVLKSTGNTSMISRPKSGGNSGSAALRPRPQPIAGTPPPDPNEKCDAKIIQQTCTLFGLDLERPPPVPPSRPYTVTGNSKLGYPQSRVMKMNFPEDSATNPPAEQLHKGETVNVVGASHRRGHLIVESNTSSFHVPFQFMELVKNSTISPVNII